MKFKVITLSLLLILCALLTSSLYARSWNVVSISKIDDVKLDEEITLSVDLNRGEFEIGEFYLSIYYDPNVLSLTTAGLGVLFEACDWEYFSYTVEPCDGCDYNLIKIEAKAEYYDNGQEATCHTGPGTLASLVFQTTTDSAAACSASPVGFYWEGCNDNLFINTYQDTLWFSDYVTDFNGANITGQPNFGGASKFCLEGLEEVPYRFLDYMTGGVYFKCALGYLCGDINGDDKINLLDPVFLTAYLFKSGDAPDPLARGDVDCSGIPPEITDLVYIVGYIFNGGAPPCCDNK